MAGTESQIEDCLIMDCTRCGYHAGPEVRCILAERDHGRQRIAVLEDIIRVVVRANETRDGAINLVRYDLGADAAAVLADALDD